MVKYVLYDGNTGAELPSTTLQPGEMLGVKFTGLDDPFDTVVMHITFDNNNVPNIDMSAGIYNWLSGGAQGWFIVPMPSVVCKGQIKLYVQSPLGTTGPTTINIGIGAIASPPVTPTTNSNPLTTLQTTLKWVAIGAGIIAVVWIASKAVPSIASSLAKTKKEMA